MKYCPLGGQLIYIWEPSLASSVVAVLFVSQYNSELLWPGEFGGRNKPKVIYCCINWFGLTSRHATLLGRACFSKPVAFLEWNIVTPLCVSFSCCFDRGVWLGLRYSTVALALYQPIFVCIPLEFCETSFLCHLPLLGAGEVSGKWWQQQGAAGNGREFVSFESHGLWFHSDVVSLV